MGAFWVGLKVGRIGDMLKFHLKYKYQVFVYLVTSLTGLVMVCHYIARLEFVLMAYYWFGAKGAEIGHERQGGKCQMMEDEWNPSIALRVCYGSIARMGKCTEGKRIFVL